MTTREKLYIANGQGFWGDSILGPVRLVNEGPLHYLTLDYLAEVTMSIMQKLKDRDPRAGYQQTLDVLALAKTLAPHVLTKSSLMLGLGETDAEIEQSMDDLRTHDVDVLTLGQYLRPTINHIPVARWVPPEAFERYREAGLSRGFREAAAGPLVR